MSASLVVETYRAGGRGWGVRFRRNGSIVPGSVQTGFQTRERARAAARGAISEARRRRGVPGGGSTAASASAPASEHARSVTSRAATGAVETVAPTPAPAPALPTVDEIAGALRVILASPQTRAVFAEQTRRVEDAAALEMTRARIGPQLEARTDVGALLRERLDEITAASTGVLRERDGAPIPRAATRFPERVQNTNVDWLVAQANERAARRAEALGHVFPER